MVGSVDILWHGRGGQGAFTASRILGAAYVSGESGKLSLTHRGEPFLDEVEIKPVVRHCPEQAFFDLDPRCGFHCAFCSSPVLDPSEDKHLSTESIMAMLKESTGQYEVKAVSFTRGVVGSVDETVDRFVDVVRATRAAYPDMPIGVEPYVSSREHVQRLKDAGSDEIKLNLQCSTPELFARICPTLITMVSGRGSSMRWRSTGRYARRHPSRTGRSKTVPPSRSSHSWVGDESPFPTINNHLLYPLGSASNARPLRANILLMSSRFPKRTSCSAVDVWMEKRSPFLLTRI